MTSNEIELGEDPVVEAPPPPVRSRVDLYLNLGIAVVLVAIVGLGSLFAYQVYREDLRQEQASPARRVVRALTNEAREHPNDPLVRSRLAEALATLGRYDDAVEQLNAAILIKPDYVGAYENMGVILRIAGEPEQARKAFDKVLELTETSGYEQINQRREVAYFHLGDIALSLGEYEEAIGNFKAALRIRKDASDTYVLLAMAFRGLDENDAARENLMTAMRFDPNFARAHYELGLILQEEDDLPAAAEEFRRAADLVDNTDQPQEALSALGSSESWLERAETAKADGGWKEALDAARVALAIDPNSLPAALLRAQMHEKIGETQNAINMYKAIQKLHPDNTEAPEALKRLGESAEGDS